MHIIIRRIQVRHLAINYTSTFDTLGISETIRCHRQRAHQRYFRERKKIVFSCTHIIPRTKGFCEWDVCAN